MGSTCPTVRSDNRSIAGRRIIFLLFGALFAASVTGASDSLYSEYILKADSLFSAGRYESSFAMAQQARDEAAKEYGEEDTLVAWALYQMGECCYQLANRSDAEKYWTTSLAIRQKLRNSDHDEVADCLHGLAEIAYDRAQYARAESLYIRAADIRERLQGQERIKLARTLNGIANSVYMRGQYPKAEHLYYRALEVTRQAVGERHRLSLSLSTNVGLVLIRMGKNDEALAVLQKTVPLAEEISGPRSPVLYSILSSIGLIYRRFAEHEKAASVFERTVKIIEDSLGRDSYLLAIPLLNLGKVYRSLGNLQAAERCLLWHLDIMNTCCSEQELEMAAAATTLARIYYDQGDSAAFRQYYQQARSTYEQSLDAGYLDLPSGLMNFSNYFRPYDGETSLEFARHGFELRRNYLLSNYLDMSEAEAVRFSWYMREAASYYLSAFLDLKSSGSVSQIVTADIIFASKGQVSDEIFERNVAVFQNTSSDVLALRDSLGQAKNKLSAIYVSGHYGDRSGGYETKRDSLIAEISRMESALIEYGSSRPRFREPHYVTTGHVAEALPDGSALIEYLRFDYVRRNPDTITTHYLVTIVKPNAVEPIILDLGPAEIIDSMVSDYRLHMTTAATRGETTPDIYREYNELAGRLFAEIWEPIDAKVIDCSLLLIAPDGALNLLSFAGLPDEQGRYLIERFPIHYLSSGRDAIWLNHKAKKGVHLLALGDPDYDASALERKAATQGFSRFEDNRSLTNYPGVPGLQRGAGTDCRPVSDYRVTRLPATRNEVEQISELWRQGRSDTALCFLGKAASEDNLKMHAPGNRAIHIATHGYFSPAVCGQEKQSYEPGEYSGRIEESPLLQSGLFLAGSNLHGEMADSLGIDDGILTAEEVSMMELTGVEWVVLSACESGLGEIEAGEGVYGLRRAFQMAGARTVISSLWPVTDRGTAEFMISLYKTSGQTLYKRIHQYQTAQIERLRNHGYSDHPYQWAAFIATGDWR